MTYLIKLNWTLEIKNPMSNSTRNNKKVGNIQLLEKYLRSFKAKKN